MSLRSLIYQGEAISLPLLLATRKEIASVTPFPRNDKLRVPHNDNKSIYICHFFDYFNHRDLKQFSDANYFQFYNIQKNPKF